MEYYVIVNNTQILTAENSGTLARYYGEEHILPEDYEQNKYIVQNGKLVLNPDFEAEQAQKERERLNMLSLTAADVERAIYKAKGMDFDDVLEMIETLQFAGTVDIDLKALKIELKANNFYRGNPYIDAVGTILGFTPEMLDRFFESGEWEELVKLEDVEFPSEEDLNSGETSNINIENVTNINTEDEKPIEGDNALVEPEENEEIEEEVSEE